MRGTLHHGTWSGWVALVLLATLSQFSRAASIPTQSLQTAGYCHRLPGDPGWPSDGEWQQLNTTTGGRLIRGVPLAEPCYSPTVDANRAECVQIAQQWVSTELYYDDPVNVMAPYWLNDSCSPFATPNSTCDMGNIAVYALDIDGPDTARAGLLFAQEKNIRLSIKNTGHDYIGRSNGQGSLALWTHNLKNMTFFNYSSPHYTGPALRAGAGVQFFEVYEAAAEQGLRVLGGFCPSVGLVGGFVQRGGYGPLSSSYGLAADNALEFEVVTVDGRHLTASPTENADLYWALAGGGGGNYAVVLSLTTRAHPDGVVAGASLSFLEATNGADAYWDGVAAFQTRLLALNAIPGLTISWSVSSQQFAVNMATLADGTEADLASALQPFVSDLARLGVQLAAYNTTQDPNYYAHFERYTFNPDVYQTNSSLGGRLIPPSTVQRNLTGLIDVFRTITSDPEYPLNLISATNPFGNPSNAVLPAWRDALYTLNAAIGYGADASVSELQAVQARVNAWQGLFDDLTSETDGPGGGGYMNEATFNDPDWKADYFGANYEPLLAVKRAYDPGFALWQHTSVGEDDVASWEVAGDGRLCRRDWVGFSR